MKIKRQHNGVSSVRILSVGLLDAISAKRCRLMLSLCLHVFFFIGFVSGQLSGYGELDGMYGFTMELSESDDSFMEGDIIYEGSVSSNPLIATRRGDTLRCQELNEMMNPVSTFLVIKKGMRYVGEWYDENEGLILPLIIYPTKSSATTEYKARRFAFHYETDKREKLFTIPLSPTVEIGKFIDQNIKEIVPFSSQSSFGRTKHYCEDGMVILDDNSKLLEEVSMEIYRYKLHSFSIEAMIPSFSEVFMDSLQSALVHWKDELNTKEFVVPKRRFPVRIYAICDIDFWSDDIVSGSFEYVSPMAQGDGFTFIFDRKGDRFITMDQLIRSGKLPPNPHIDSFLGLSFDRYGLIVKGKFSAIKDRMNRHRPWSQLDIKLKRKLNDEIR